MEDHGSVGYIEHGPAVAASALDKGTVGVDDEVLLKMSEAIPEFAEVTQNAHNANELEHRMSVGEAFRLYPKAICFSAILSLAIIMEGYDTSLLGSFYAYPEFQERFGVRLADGSYQVTSQWQSGLQNGAQIGEILGLMVAGIIAERFGYKKTMFGALVLMIGCVFLLFFAQNVGMLFAGEILCGIPWGAFQTLTTTYAAEVSPIVLRPYLTTYVNMCWVIGQLISAGVLRGLLGRTDQWAWRIPYAIQWIWPVPIIVGVVFAPESPWWLVRKGRAEDAKKALLGLTSRTETNWSIDDTIALMIHTNEHEKSISAGLRYWDCFRGVDLRRTEIVSCVWMIQVFCGIWYGGNVVYFLEQAGFDATKSFDFGVGENAIAVCGTLCSWFVMQRVGRRTLYLWGLAILFVILVAIGFMGIPAAGPPAVGWASGALLVVFVFTYDITIGPVCYCLVSEIPSTRLRIKSVIIARNCYNVASIVANFLNPPILNPSAWNLRGKGGFIWCGFCLICFVWSYFRLPEPKGLTPPEMDVLFEQKVSARNFSKVKAEPFRSTNLKIAPMGAEEIHFDEKK